MELTSNPDILRVSKTGTKFFVNGFEMALRAFDEDRVFLSAEKANLMDGYGFIHVRCGDGDHEGRAVFEIEELIDRLKTGRFIVN